MNEIPLNTDQFATLCDFLAVGAVLIDPDRRVISMNETAELLTGITQKAATGRRCSEVFAGYLCGGDCLFERAAAEGRTALATDIHATDADGEPHHLTKVVSPLFDPRGRPLGCLEVFEDHSAFDELLGRVRHESQRMKLILDNMDQGVMTVDRKGYVTFFNTAAETMTRFRRQEVLGKSCAGLFGRNRFDNEVILCRTVKDGGTRSGREGTLTTRDGLTLPVRANYMALNNEAGRIMGGLATFTDLSLVYQLDSAMRDRYTFHDMVGKSPAMQKIFEILPVIAKSDATVLVEGETGTGKDILAKVIHAASDRADKPLVKVNCAALPENLLESEMFGYVKGAFTGADKDKSGRFQEADGGTIFLDEIGDLPLALQAKLLTVLEDKEFYPLGSRKTTRVDVRIISATNLGLERQVRERQFREDLFYRLNVMRLELPGLKDRREDLPLLISHILKTLCAKRNIQFDRISEEAMEVLLNHDYPGNIRELENILEHALIICQGPVIERKHLPLSLTNAREGEPETPPGEPAAIGETPSLRSAESAHERDRIIAALEKHRWHKGRAAEALGVNRTTLWRKMKKHGISTRT
jgi:PAS domain S-box-containing protein